MSGRCYLVGAGEFVDSLLPGDGDYIIAADAGYNALISRDITPDMVVGDFDSLGSIPDHPNVIQSPVEKDDTDMMLAVRKGFEMGYTEFIINGGLGGRLDQTLANIQILAFISESDSFGLMLGNDVCITAITGGEIELTVKDAKNKTFSVFSHGGKAEGVTLKGLKYPLENATITDVYPIGVSNKIIDDTVTVSVDEGTLIIMYDGGFDNVC